MARYQFGDVQTEQKAEQIVSAIVDELVQWGGLKEAWGSMSETSREQLQAMLTANVHRELSR